MRLSVRSATTETELHHGHCIPVDTARQVASEVRLQGQEASCSPSNGCLPNDGVGADGWTLARVLLGSRLDRTQRCGCDVGHQLPTRLRNRDMPGRCLERNFKCQRGKQADEVGGTSWQTPGAFSSTLSAAPELEASPG